MYSNKNNLSIWQRPRTKANKMEKHFHWFFYSDLGVLLVEPYLHLKSDSKPWAQPLPPKPKVSLYLNIVW